MSQPPPYNTPQPNPNYPYPNYTQPGVPYQGYPYGVPNPLETLLGPARMASIVMFIVGPLGLLIGFCMLCSGAVVASPEFTKNPEMQRSLDQYKMTAQQLQAVAPYILAVGALFMIFALAMGVMAFLVRRGTRGPVLISLIVTAAAILAELIMTIAAANLFGACFGLLSLALLGTQLFFLIQALNRSTLVAQWREYLTMSANPYMPQSAAYAPPAPQYPVGGPPPPPPPQSPSEPR